MPDGNLRLTLYTRENCPLCEEAKRVLFQVRRELNGAFDVVEVDIAGSRELTDAYGSLIPVVEHRGETLFIGKVSAHRLRRLVREGDGGGGPLTGRYKAYLARLKSLLGATPPRP